MKDWGVKLTQQPETIETTLLPLPTIIKENGQELGCEPMDMSKLAIQKAVHLSFESWFFAYDDSIGYNEANNLY